MILAVDAKVVCLEPREKKAWRDYREKADYLDPEDLTDPQAVPEMSVQMGFLERQEELAQPVLQDNLVSMEFLV